MRTIIKRKIYDTETADCVADDRYWDVKNQGRNTYLYKTKKGNFFMLNTTRWQGENNTITPLSENEAVDRYDKLQEHHQEFEEVFPNIKVEEA